jgi:hypothetical protein
MAASSPPQVGIPVSKASLDAAIGANAQSLKKVGAGLGSLHEWQAGYTSEQLTDLYGYSPEEATLFKSACGEIPSILATLDALVFLPKTAGV